MIKLFAVMLNTFRESIRDRIFYSLLAFAVMMLSFSLVVSHLTLGDEIKIIKDFGLSAISIFGVLISVFVGISLVYKEMEKRTIYVILANPISRLQFLLGKYFGLSLTLLAEVLVMSVGLFIICYFKQEIIPWSLLKAIIPIWLELQLILAVALVFSTFVSPFLSGLFTLAVFIIGHLTQDFKLLVKSMDNVFIINTADALYYIFPNLENINFKARVVHGLDLPWGEFFISIGYAIFYTVFLLLLAIVIFEKRDIR